ncbi:hypothetical protein HXX76_003913 [Chlamydomonas incerta]|uniref:BACK domain-containing protein n=1 Tax=Chlamydomonas incerta TaxID=51695 RepID=A0A835TLJ0_CHLIN|nr:hypothetical protein HXX76_003913 [Chlamydomonas incerta]|eukprot:KAG2441060.1 hypothetical protein HXX76_003913 [Chlamydomonas incerta]
MAQRLQRGATASVNAKLAAAIAGRFGQSEDADCQLVFVLDPAPPTGGEPHGGGSAAGGSGAIHKKEVARLGEPLPAHLLVLKPASDKIAAQMKWAQTGGGEESTCGPPARPNKKARKSGAAAKSAAPQKQLPELQIMLGGEEELPAAHAAIQFAYTNCLEAGISVRKALQVRRQAAYLQMDGRSSGNAAVLELYGSSALWPDPAEDAAFAAMLTGAKRRLVAHFGDALAVLNDPARYEQMVALPAVGLEALLESDGFGSDSESSVVLVLAEWMAANYASTDEALRRRLCGLLRLVQCSRTYLCGVLPVLAARHQRSPTSAAGWFEVNPAQATSMVAYSTASAAERKAMAAEGAPWGPCAGMATVPAGWRNTQPRRQCLPAAGRSYDFSVSLKEMETCFGALEPGEKGYLIPRVPASRLGSHIVAQGLEWRPYLQSASGASTAGFFVTPSVPAALLAASSASGTAAAEDELLMGAVAAVPRVQVSVCGAAGQQAWSGQLGGDADSIVRMGYSWGVVKALEWREAAINQQTGNNSNGAAGSSGNSKLAACWAPYLQGGSRLEGSIVLLPPAP